MNTRCMLAAAIGLLITGTVVAQEKKEVKEESIVIRKKGDKKEKITVVVDGDQVLINGKPVEEYKDGDVEIIRGKAGRLRATSPLAKGFSPRNYMNGNLYELPLATTVAGNKAMLGVYTETDDKGAKITNITKDGAAEKAGLKKDDIITKVDDEKIANSNDLSTTIGKHKPDDKVLITYLRDGKEATVSATLGKNKSAYSFNWNDSDFDIEIPEIPEMPRFEGQGFNFSRKPKVGIQVQDLEEGKGVKVLDVDTETPAEKAGLKKDDIITEVDGKELEGVDAFRNVMRAVKEGDTVKLKLKRNGKSQNVDLKFPKKLKTADL